jgi:hypothetical protein
MQNAKDTFYEVMRTRLAAVNPERTIVVRGVTRPALLVEENELPVGEVMTDCFRLRWTSEAADAMGAMPAVTMTCEVLYTTAGTAVNSGMDRGRVLGAMDAELAAMVNACPQHALKTNYAGLEFGQAAVEMGTNVWWGDVVFGAGVVKDERVSRTATVVVMAYQEAGEK